MKDQKLTRRQLMASMAAAAIAVAIPGGAQARDSSMDTVTTIDFTEAPANSIVAWPERVPVSDLGVAQQSNEKLAWLLDAKFGMFIHWGLYSGPGEGEWYQHTAKMLPEDYRELAYPISGDQYFSADKYDPGHWAAVAKAAGMRWMCLTTRHHDGFSLFDNPHHNAFTSMQTHKKDFVAEYIQSVREHGLKVGLYFSPICWRYPGYYDVTGTDCKPNVFGYVTESTHKENARVWKSENYAAVKKLMTSYGKIDHVFWDGGWLAEQGSDADGAYFHEPGEYLDPNNPWQISKEYLDYDESGRPLGIMGMVRKYQPDLLCNLRYGWIGDYINQEGGPPTKGPFNTTQVSEKCLTMQKGPWGYSKDCDLHGAFLTRDDIIAYLANCVVRNMFFLLNVGPDRHGQIPPKEEAILRDTGAWLEKVGDAIYGTRCGPWQPVDGEYGFCRKNNKLFIHILKNYNGQTFSVPPIGPLQPARVYDVFSNRSLPFSLNSDRTITISGIDRTANSVDTIVCVQFDKDVMSYAVQPKPLS